MATDIAPELYSAIERDFSMRVKTAPDIRAFTKRLEAGTATAEDVSTYAGRLGDCASAALISVLTEESLPDGRLYWNIAQRTIKPLMQKVHTMVNDAAIIVQRREDAALNIGLNPIRAPFPEERMNSLINRMIDEFDKQGDQNNEQH